ncbi:quinolinate synthase NadA [Asaia sp. HumB]|uniref:Quinolinate synthase n=3 Tax=Acetobacteraceae TaxID=433 RepID=A0AAN4R348_9PROT|nr:MULTISPECIES: quinolinate synthase NadA [Asaia]ETC98040.1 quinolinate synthetase [Asaia sp. SF2.1]MDL2171831.1 quinolinate synthase NadA [Asaia sp. HumB]NIE81338.1 quinolinate synthase NadA [Asaia sp. As-1742]CDG40030.1 Quinolinate synthetase [Asaia bogorensis]BAT19091.1 quinolinate synthetase complex subunit alpha [Asaia bogorensis NBRC 16594]
MDQMTLVRDRGDALYEPVSRLMTREDWERNFEDDIRAILRLKRERNAVILAHNYQTPEIFHCISDIRGDSLALAREAQRCEEQVIVMAGVHFMAETAKLMNPEKTVLIPDSMAGCSLAESITAENVRALKAAYPGVPVVTYVNSSVAVKAETDICCTSGNAKKVVESLGVPRVIMIPDEFLAKNIQNETGIEMLTWPGHCEVHERFTPLEIRQYRRMHPGVVVLAHPECPPEVVAEADYAGSTAGMMEFVAVKQPAKVLLVTECSMSDNLAALNPAVEFVRPCNLCPHMKRITLPAIRRALETMQEEVTIPDALFPQARRAVERMLAV